jgi:hypothetical protein
MLRRRKDNIKINLMERGQEVVGWIRVVQSVAYPGILFGVGSTNSVEDRGQR